ncbi:MAG: type II secretion system F family protein [Thermoproteota archaeon]
MKGSRLCIFASFATMWFFVHLQNLLAFLVLVFIVVFFVMLEERVRLWMLWQSVLLIVNRTASLCQFALPTRLKVAKPTNNSIVALLKPIIEQRTLARVQALLADSLAGEISSSGKAANPKTLSQQSLAYAVLAFFIATPLGVILGLLGGVFFALLAVPPLVFLFPLWKLKLSRQERRGAIEDELAFFAVYGSVMQSVGRSLYDAILQAIGKRIFPVIESDGRMLGRNVALFGMDQLTAINTLALPHPNTSFRNLLLGYVSIQKSGGDLRRYMESKSEEFFSQAKFRFFKYASSAESVAEILLILLNVLPILLIMSSFLMSGESLRIITTISFVAVPVMTATILIFVSNMQPKTHDVIGTTKYSMVAGIVVGMVAFFVVSEAWFVFAVAAIAASLSNFIGLAKQFAEIRMVETALPDFLRDITECMKIGLDIPNAVIRISNERKYNGFFDDVVSYVSSQISFGQSISDATEKMSIRSWQAKISFFVLGKIVESGGGSPQVLEHVTDFSTKINQAKAEMANRVRVFTFMVYVSPLLMAWATYGMKELLDKIGPEYSRMAHGFGASLSVSPDFVQLVNLLIVISSLCMSLVISKLAYFTVKHTLAISITCSMAIVAVYVVPLFPSIS